MHAWPKRQTEEVQAQHTPHMHAIAALHLVQALATSAAPACPHLLHRMLSSMRPVPWNTSRAAVVARLLLPPRAPPLALRLRLLLPPPPPP